MLLAERLFEIYFAGTTHHARAKVNGGTVSYYPIEGVPTLGEIEEHLAGEIVLGAYTLLPDSTCRWICLDVDTTDRKKARNLAEAISEALGDLPHTIEFSGNKGYHIWIFLASPLKATDAKAFGLKLRETVGAPASGENHVEVFPKQDKLSSSSPLGNLVKLPLGIHPSSHSRSVFVNRANGWEDGIAVEPEPLLERKVDGDRLATVLEETSPLRKIVSLLGPYWVDGERHNLCLALAGYLASIGWRKDEVDGLIGEMVAQGGGDVENLLECVDTTYGRLARGLTVQGFSGLNERLPVGIMRSFSELAGQNIADPILQIIDRIRMDKMVPFMKVRSTERTVTSFLKERGKFLIANNRTYWMNNETHGLVDCESTPWLALMSNQFGLNEKEGFGAQVMNALLLRAHDEGEKVDVHKRFYWNGSKLKLNFGGSEVYTLTGDRGERAVGYNGDEGLFFLTDGLNGLATEIGSADLLDVPPLNPWDFLTNDLNFASTERNAATNDEQQQMVRAWMLQMFFGEILPTRPIGLFLGPRGSGKTTAARRILRFIEGFNEDVLSIIEDKPDSLRASLEEHLVLVLDNLEKTKAKWVDNYLNRLATGAHIELRRLHKTNEKYVIKPNVFVLLTGIEVPSSEEALFSRMLPIEFAPLGAPKPEYYMQSRLKDNITGIWAGMFDDLDSAVSSLNANRWVDAPTQSRLADFAVFCRKLRDCKAIEYGVLESGLAKLVVTQNRAMTHSSPAVAAIELWLEDCNTQMLAMGDDKDSTIWRSTGELFRILQETASKKKLDTFRWNQSNGFGRHFSYLVDQLRMNYGMEVQEVHDNASGKDIKQYRFIRNLVK